MAFFIVDAFNLLTLFNRGFIHIQKGEQNKHVEYNDLSKRHLATNSKIKNRALPMLQKSPTPHELLPKVKKKKLSQCFFGKHFFAFLYRFLDNISLNTIFWFCLFFLSKDEWNRGVCVHVSRLFAQLVIFMNVVVCACNLFVFVRCTENCCTNISQSFIRIYPWYCWWTSG